MKRSALVLQKERTEAESDARLRRQLQAEAAAEERQTRVAHAISAKAKALEGHLAHWKKAGVIAASNYALTAPAQSPLGTSPFEHVDLPCASGLLPSWAIRTLPPCLGATPNPSCFPRNPSRLESVFAFLPKESVTFLSNMVSSNVLNGRSREQAETNRHFAASSNREVLLWVAQRCEITLDVKETIKDAYKNVYFLEFIAISL